MKRKFLTEILLGWIQGSTTCLNHFVCFCDINHRKSRLYSITPRIRCGVYHAKNTFPSKMITLVKHNWKLTTDFTLKQLNTCFSFGVTHHKKCYLSALTSFSLNFKLFSELCLLTSHLFFSFFVSILEGRR